MTWDGTERRRRDVGNRARRAIVGVFLVTYRRQAETIVGFLLLVVGAWLMLPFATFPVSASYTWLATLHLPEWALGAGLAGVGGAGLLASVRGQRRPRSVALLVMLGLSVFMAVAYALGSIASLGVALFAALAAIAFVSMVYLEWAEAWTSHRG